MFIASGYFQDIGYGRENPSRRVPIGYEKVKKPPRVAENSHRGRSHATSQAHVTLLTMLPSSPVISFLCFVILNGPDPSRLLPSFCAEPTSRPPRSDAHLIVQQTVLETIELQVHAVGSLSAPRSGVGGAAEGNPSHSSTSPATSAGSQAIAHGFWCSLHNTTSKSTTSKVLHACSRSCSACKALCMAMVGPQLNINY